MGQSHVGFAIGVCVVAAGLLMGSASGAVAAADSDSSESASDSDAGANTAAQATTAASTNSAGDAADAATKTVGVATSTLGSGRQPGDGATGRASSSENVPGGSTAHATQAAQSTQETQGTQGTQNGQEGQPLGSAIPNPSTTLPNVDAPVTTQVGTSTANTESPVPQPAVTNVVEPVPVVVAPISGVIAAVQDIPAQVASAVLPLTQLQSELAAWWWGTGETRASLQDGSRSHPGAGLPVFTSPTSVLLPMVGVRSVPLAGNAAWVVGPAGIAASSFSEMAQSVPMTTLPVMAPFARGGAVALGGRSFLRRDHREVVLPPPLSALLIVALPGVGGLMILTATGMRIGYRQAKAAVALRTTAMSRFTCTGPLGVVHSGSLIVLRPVAGRVVRPVAGRGGRHLKQAA